MVNLIPYNTNSFAEFLSIVNDKNNPRRNRLIALQNIINERYILYNNNFSATQIHTTSVSDYTVQQKEDLLHCYTSATDSLNKLIKKIKENQLIHIRGTCQFCGINSDSTTDHYLPKGLFPDYCVNILNLLPCCPTCNSLKWEFWFNAQLNTREIINLYLDNLPTVQFLYVNITFNDDIPNADFIIQNVNGISAPLYLIIENHFQRLNLLYRYKELFNSIYHQTLHSFKGNPVFLNNIAFVQDLLSHDAEGLLNDYGANYWKGIIKKSLSTNNHFLTLCST